MIESGRSALESGDIGAARQAFETAASIRIGDPVSRRLLAEVCLRTGDRASAREVLRDVAMLQPDDGNVLSRLAKLELELGNSEAGSELTMASAAALRRQIRRQAAALLTAPLKMSRALAGSMSGQGPDFKTAWLCETAGAALASRRLGEAADLLRRAEERAAGDPGVLYLQGRLLAEFGDTHGACVCLTQAQEARPDEPSIQTEAIIALARAEFRDEAFQQLQGLPAKVRDSTEGKLAQAHAYSADGRMKEASDLLTPLLNSGSGNRRVAVFLAATESRQGNFEKAREVFQTAARLSPRSGNVFWGAVVSRCMKRDDPLFAGAQKLSENPEASQLDRALAELAIGRALIDSGDQHAGFAHLKKGNAMLETEYDPSEQEARIDALIEAFPRSLYHGRQLPDRGEGRLFIVGLPRSGSTLVEQILASHPMVFAAGEATHLPRLAQGLEKEHGFPHAIGTIDQGELNHIAEEYLARVGSGSGQEPVVTDKNLFNVYYLGLIALLFPKAKIVHCRRDPMDNGYSIYSHRFNTSYPYANDLRTIGHHFKQYHRLMTHWKATLPIEIHEIFNEQLVEEPEQEIRKLLGAVGLPFDAACLRFHETRRNVATSSLAQVRQGISRASVGGWRKFEAELEPLREMVARLEPAHTR